MLQQPVRQEMCGLHQANHQWVTVFLFTPTPLTQLHSSYSRPYYLHLVYEPSHEQGEEALTCTLWTFDVFRFGRGQVHLLWGAAVAQRVFYLHAVLRVSSGTWFPHSAWQHRVHWLQQGEVSFHRLGWSRAQTLIQILWIHDCFFFFSLIYRVWISNAKFSITSDQ